MNSNLQRVVIRGIGSVSPLGCTEREVWTSYEAGKSCIRPLRAGGKSGAKGGEKLALGAKISETGEESLARLIEATPRYGDIDRTAQFAVLASIAAAKSAGWMRKGNGTPEIGVAIGSSRGATGLWEEAYRSFIESDGKRVPVLTSPTTTLGNIASWAAQAVGASGIAVSHSNTCSTSLHAVGMALAWLRAGMATRFIAGGAEAALTPFTIAQMRALRIYSEDLKSDFPCRPFSAESPPHNTLVLGEGSAVLALETLWAGDEPGKDAVFVDGFGYGIEQIETNTSLSADGESLKVAMQRALADMQSPGGIDLIIAHAPGTIQGGRSEMEAIRAVFGEQHPPVVSHKWMIGHTFGAAGSLALEYAALVLKNQKAVEFPYASVMGEQGERLQGPFRKVMVNAAGFGGNAAAVVLGG